MADELRILLASPDLMATSRIAQLAREAGAVVETIRSLEAATAGCTGGYRLVLLDLQAFAGDPAVLVTQLRALLATLPGHEASPPLVAFGPHVHRQRLEDARAAGADDVLSRGEVLGGFPALVRRWCLES
jgi:CheY-like chemotaxis protein